MKIILATQNKGKVKEFNVLAEGTNLEFIPLPEEVGNLPEETGTTFQENALIKAKFAFENCGGTPCLADDSGLEVNFLDGAPGIYSARYSEEGTDDSNTQKLLKNMHGVPKKDRKASFKCSLVLIGKDCDHSVEGSFEGEIGTSLRGKNGFGYDPIFVLPESGLHLAELNHIEKIKVSHRSIAFNKLKAVLEVSR